MPVDYSERSFIGDVFFPAFESGKILGVGVAGQVNPIDLPILEFLVFNQTTPSSSWEFTHNFGVAPFVVVYDTNDTNITDAVVIFCDESIVRIQAENNLITGRVEVYRLGVDAIPVNVGSRTTKAFTINSAIAINANYTTFITLSKFYQLLSFECLVPVRLRIYNSQPNQQDDLGRSVNALPTNDVGLIFDGFTTLANPLIKLSPVATGYNLDGSNISYITLTNLSTAPLSTLNFNLIYLPLEA